MLASWEHQSPIPPTHTPPHLTQDLFVTDGTTPTDASGNAILKDIGMYLRDTFKSHFKDQADIKYIDPSYLIRWGGVLGVGWGGAGWGER